MSNVRAKGPASDGTYALSWRVETEYWADALKTYANATRAVTDNARSSVVQLDIDAMAKSADNACLQLMAGSYTYGQ
jgi:hypothetical protein